MKKAALGLVAWTVSALLLGSCGTLDLLRRDVRAMKQDTKIFGSVTGPKNRIVKVLVLKKSGSGGGFTVADSTSPNGMGDFAFLLPREKSYYLAAIEKNSILRPDAPHELVGIAGNKVMKEIPWREDSARQEIVLKLAPDIDRKTSLARDVSRAVDAWKPENGTGGSIPIACGDVVSLADPAFDAASGVKGLWAPLTAARLHGLGIYFLQPYLPAKVPVIFVHGIGGTPRIWEPLIRSLDKRRYQPWIYAYPSGLPIEDSAKALADLTHRLQRHHHFTRIHVVAHSMGGLVSRRAVQMIHHEKHQNYVSSLTTISTPWNGVYSSVLGTLGLPVPIPCWLDLKPDGEFVGKILSAPMPVPHLLVSTEKSRFRFALERRNDGSVSVASQLDPRALSQATASVMIHEEHNGVLAADETLKAVGAFLDSPGRQTRLKLSTAIGKPLREHIPRAVPSPEPAQLPVRTFQIKHAAPGALPGGTRPADQCLPHSHANRLPVRPAFSPALDQRVDLVQKIEPHPVRHHMRLVWQFVRAVKDPASAFTGNFHDLEKR